jgi:hypothetical protein
VWLVVGGCSLQADDGSYLLKHASINPTTISTHLLVILRYSETSTSKYYAMPNLVVAGFCFRISAFCFLHCVDGPNVIHNSERQM